MPIVTVIVASGGTDHRLSHGDTPSAGGVEVLVSWRNFTVVSERFFVCLCIGGMVEDASFQGVERASLETELGPFPYSRDWAGEGNHSAQEKLAAVELHFLVPISALKGVLRQNRSITEHCVSSWGFWGAARAAAPNISSPKLCLIPHFMLMSCHQTQTSSLQPRWLRE